MIYNTRKGVMSQIPSVIVRLFFFSVKRHQITETLITKHLIERGETLVLVEFWPTINMAGSVVLGRQHNESYTLTRRQQEVD